MATAAAAAPFPKRRRTSQEAPDTTAPSPSSSQQPPHHPSPMKTRASANGVGRKPPELRKLPEIRHQTPQQDPRKRKAGAEESPAINGTAFRPKRINGAASAKQKQQSPAEILSPAIRASQRPYTKLDPKQEMLKGLRVREREVEIENEELRREIEAEERRLKREAKEARERCRAEDTAELIAKFLSANDKSLPTAALKQTPRYTFEAAFALPDIPSALPIRTADPLPYLTAFSSLCFKRASTIPSPEPCTQTHTITGHAGADRHLFFTLALSVNTSSNSVSSLECSVSSWAKPELSPIIARCQTDCDPATLLYALDTYAVLNERRGRRFAALCRRYSSSGILPAFSRGSRGKEFSRRELVPHNGRSALVLRREREREKEKEGGGGDRVEFVLRWRITFDETGEALAAVEGLPSVPQSWARRREDLQALRRCEGVFARVVREKGVERAVEGMVGILWPDVR